MAQFCMKIAGQVACVTSSFESTIEYFRPYLTEEAPDFFAAPTAADREFEQQFSIREALEEGIRPRNYTGPHLERAAIQRAFAEHLFRRDTLLFHGSAVAVDGEGYLFTAGCGTGKSTHTRLWREVFGNRAVMINDDKPFLQIAPSGIRISGSPWSGKHGLDTNITVPLKGICILQRGAENHIRKITPEEALPMLRHQSYRPLEEAQYPRFLELVDQLSRQTALWQLSCNKSPDAAVVSHAAMSYCSGGSCVSG